MDPDGPWVSPSGAAWPAVRDCQAAHGEAGSGLSRKVPQPIRSVCLGEGQAGGVYAKYCQLPVMPLSSS